jgi:putative membrane protein
MQNRKLADYLVIVLKGMAMGAADVVPGVSGGTIAFISGIYEELLDSINAVNFSLFKVLKTKGIKAVWKKVNGNFLLSLVLGIGISVISLAKMLSWLLINKPVLLWSFFFGLVLASIWFVGKQITSWNFKTILAIVLAAVFAYFITQLQPINDAGSSFLYIVLSGALAISATILPGLSGSFVLVLLGVYQLVLNAVHQRDLAIISLFGLGAVLGLLSFARLLKYIFENYRNITLAILTGFIIGALNKIWPWKNIVDSVETNVSPFNFSGDNQLLYVLLLATLGFLLILVLEKWGNRQA